MNEQRRHIGVIAAPGAPHAVAMTDALRALGATPVVWDVGHAARPGAMTLASTQAKPVFDVAFVDVLPMAVPRAYPTSDGYRLYDDWQRDWLEATGRRALLEARLAELEASGVTLVSSPLSATAYNKPAQMAALARAGLPVPRFVITNDVKQARAFLKSCKDAVMKPAIGGGLCVPITARGLDPDALLRSPSILQARVRGDDIRVTTVRGQMLSVVRIVNDAADGANPDFRAQPGYGTGATRYEPVRAPASLTRLCTRILTTCGMHFGGIDFKRDAEGGFHLLECNAQPGWLAIQNATNAPIASGLARYLVGLRATSRRRSR